MLSLVWVFVSCFFLCFENDSCKDDSADSTEISVVFENPSHEDACPIQATAKTTLNERVFFKLEPATVSGKFSTSYSSFDVVNKYSKHQTEFYLPPKLTSQNKRPFILRI